jgi:PAS domain S-box-containing protein
MNFRRGASAAPSLAEQLAEICDSVPEIVYWAGPGGRCQYLNQTFYSYTGLVRSSPGYGWESVVHPADLGPIQRRFLDPVFNGKPYIYCFRLRDSNGKYHWFTTRSYPLHDPNHQTALWVGISTNVDNLVASQRVKPEEWHVTSDPNGRLDNENAIFEVVDPSGQHSEVVCQFGSKAYEPLNDSPVPPANDFQWKIRELVSLPPQAFLAREQILRVDTLVSLFSEVLARLGWPYIPLSNLLPQL